MKRSGLLLVFLILITFKGRIHAFGDLASRQLEKWEQTHQVQERATDLNGIPYASLTSTQSIGVDGPGLLQDRYLLERLANLNRERVQERYVHAKGLAAHGTFTVTHDISRYSKARIFNKIGKQTPVFLRYSATAGENGFADTVPDAKGFAVKFYTEDGNWDLVGNQIEVFHTRDPMLFTDVNRSRKRNPQTGTRDLTMKWDIIQQRPESTHHVLKSASDINHPESLRMVNGSGVHTFKLVNGQNEPFFCKFHFVTHQKFERMSSDREKMLAGSDPNYYQRELYNAIKAGNFPRWTLAVQVATVSQAESYRWNYLDITKNWRPEDFPLLPVGILELNRMPENFFADSELSAFSPANLVPGIEPSGDPMLHARMFSYVDAQRYRLGVNHVMLPINRPLNHIATYERDGFMCLSNNGGGAPNYHPNSFGGPEVDPTARQLPYFLSGEVIRIDTTADDNFSQPKVYLEKDVTPEERERMATRLGSQLASVASEPVVELVFARIFRPLGGNFEQMVRAAYEHAKRNPPMIVQERS